MEELMRLMRLLISMMAMVHHCTGELARATCSAPHNNTVLGDRANTFRHNRSGSFEDCCVMCAGSATPPRCVAFTFEPGTGSSPGVCFLKSSGAPVAHKPGARSGTVAAPPTTPPLPPPPPPPGNVTAVVSVSRGPELNRIDDGFKTWNIDASPNRGWDRRDLSNPTLRSLGRLSRPGYLRFGGAGNDGLNYALDMAAPGSTGNGCAAGASRCLNRTWVDNLCGFAEASGARLVFGLNVNVRKGTGAIGAPGEGVWDPAEARAMIKYAIGANHSFWGFELGNEQNWRYSPAASAADFAILRDLLTELFPDAATRPKIVGPDCHGLHNDPNGPGDGRDKAAIRYLAEFISNCTALGVPLHAVTHHEYVDVDPDPSAPATANQLDVTGQIASAMVAGLAGSRARALPAVVQLWAGEIGPHNGGTVPCDHTSMRWANWGDTFWYLDAMATKAARGYSVFCRQDFVGIDYGMIDCETHSPLPDYYGGILWSNLMGQSVLSVTSSARSIRAYAHCTAAPTTPGSVTLLLLNLDPSTATAVSLAGFGGPAASTRREWHLTGPNGTDATVAALNGAALRAQIDPATGEVVLPPLDGRVVNVPAGIDVVTVAPGSIAFVQLVAAESQPGFGTCGGRVG